MMPFAQLGTRGDLKKSISEYSTKVLQSTAIFAIRPTQWPRFLKTTLTFVFLSAVYLFYLQNDSLPVAQDFMPSLPLPQDTTPSGARTYSPALVRFWITLAEHLGNARPDIPPIEVNGDHDFAKMEFEPMYHQKPRVDYINLTQSNVTEMQMSHRYMVNVSREMAPQLPYTRGTRGIVTTAGGRYTSPLLISLRMLRRTGSKLPVEVFVSSWAEYEANTCEHLLPQLNARCRILSDMFTLTPAADVISHYQYKVFAILFSSFEDVFLLDADNFPVFNPDSILKTEPFKSTGLVTWPDMWSQTSSKFFFKIADIPTPPADRLSSESGQLLYSKRKHGASLLLATYYNYYGPDYYYRLQSQNAWGMGDKETFLHAALALNMSFWDVKTPAWNVGQWVDDGNFRHVGMGQHHPEEDFSLSNGDIIRGKKIRPLLMHINWPWKLDPSSILNDDGPTRHPNGTRWRIWGTKEDIVNTFGYDAELRMWEEVLLRACEIDVSCDKIKDYYKKVLLQGNIGDEEAAQKLRYLKQYRKHGSG